MKILIARIICSVFFLHVIIPPATAAEQLSLPAPDIEAPEILFENVGDEIEAGVKHFSARVTDNVGVERVTLYYKGATDFVYRAKAMKRTSSDPNVYTTELDLDPIISSKLEIYIQAEDVTGNIIFEGGKFEPLTFTIVPLAINQATGSVAKTSEPEEEGMSTVTMVLIGLGVAVLIGAAGGGGGGSSSSSSSSEDTGSVTITTEVPN